MTFREILLTLIGQPEKAAQEASTNGLAAMEDEDSNIETLDWATTDSPAELRERAQRAAKETATVR